MASSGLGPELALNPLLKHFSGFKTRFKNGFAASSGPGPELAPKPLLKHPSGPEKCFKLGFGTSSEAGLGRPWRGLVLVWSRLIVGGFGRESENLYS